MSSSAYKPGSLKKLSEQFFKDTFKSWMDQRNRKDDMWREMMSPEFRNEEYKKMKEEMEHDKKKELSEITAADVPRGMRPEDAAKDYQDPYNPFSSNYNGEPVGPDSFGGSDYGSHYMSESIEKIKEEFKNILYKDPPKEEQDARILQELDNLNSKIESDKWQGEDPQASTPMSEFWANAPFSEEDAKQIAAQIASEDEATEKYFSSLAKVSPVNHTSGAIDNCFPAYKSTEKPYNMWKDMNDRIAKEIDQEILGEIFDPHGWIQTYTGRKFFPLNCTADDIDIEDIAHALSNICRFTGHCREFYSVAQHSVLVSYLVGPHALWGLLHDSTEAYINDIARPVKRLDLFKPYRELEGELQKVICKKFNLQPNEPTSVKQADTQMLATEARDLMFPLHPEWIQPCNPLPFKIDPLPPKEAKELFLSRYRELTGVK